MSEQPRNGRNKKQLEVACFPERGAGFKLNLRSVNWTIAEQGNSSNRKRGLSTKKAIEMWCQMNGHSDCEPFCKKWKQIDTTTIIPTNLTPENERNRGKLQSIVEEMTSIVDAMNECENYKFAKTYSAAELNLKSSKKRKRESQNIIQARDNSNNANDNSNNDSSVSGNNNNVPAQSQNDAPSVDVPPPKRQRIMKHEQSSPAPVDQENQNPNVLPIVAPQAIAQIVDVSLENMPPLQIGPSPHPQQVPTISSTNTVCRATSKSTTTPANRHKYT